MKTFNFKLRHAVKLTPLRGESEVSVSTTGDVIVTLLSAEGPKRIRQVILADTGKGILTRSPKGMHRSIHITLPFDKATELAFQRQVHELFEIAATGSL